MTLIMNRRIANHEERLYATLKEIMGHEPGTLDEVVDAYVSSSLTIVDARRAVKESARGLDSCTTPEAEATAALNLAARAVVLLALLSTALEADHETAQMAARPSA